MDYVETQITQVNREAPGYALLRFEGDAPVAGVPGQFVMVRGDWGDDPVLPRAFSIVERGVTGAILVRAVGKGTEKLVSMTAGDRLFVLGPIGRPFSQLAEERRAVLVAGGVGVAPLVFLATELAADGRRPVICYGGRTRDDLPLRNRLERLGDLHITTEDGSAGAQGLVTAPLKRILDDGAPSTVFSCGPGGMLRAVAAAARQAGADCQVALESPMACGMGTCKGCAFPTPDGGFVYVCTDGPVFDAATIYGGER
jgi:dihydroorotate dehydrogenase electron transfer subunit